MAEKRNKASRLCCSNLFYRDDRASCGLFWLAGHCSASAFYTPSRSICFDEQCFPCNSWSIFRWTEFCSVCDEFTKEIPTNRKWNSDEYVCYRCKRAISAQPAAWYRHLWIIFIDLIKIIYRLMDIVCIVRSQIPLYNRWEIEPFTNKKKSIHHEFVRHLKDWPESDAPSGTAALDASQFQQNRCHLCSALQDLAEPQEYFWY